MFNESQGRSLGDLLGEFERLRERNLATLESWQLTEEDLQKKGAHPELGPVTLGQLLATWTVHDLNHIVQVSKVMASKYTDEVGPWVEYLGVLKL